MYKQSNKFNNSISKNLYQKEWEKIKKKDGRWWFGLNMHNSDVIKPEKRDVGKPYISSNVY